MSNHIYLIVGRSGSGKTSIVEYIQNNFKERTSIESYTTRPPRYEGETGHIFVSDEEFDKLTDLVGYTEFNGYRYAATAQQVEENDFYVIDPEGVWYFAENYKGNKNVHIIVIEASLWTRFNRMRKRDGWKKAIGRIWHDHKAFAYMEELADYIVWNDDELHQAVSKVLTYIDVVERDYIAEIKKT